MASTIIFSNIKYSVLKHYLDITPTERKEGRLNARSLVSKFSDGMKIDAIVLKWQPTLISDISITFDEENIRERRTFTELKENDRRNGKLPVHTGFFRRMERGDSIIVLLSK